MLDSMEPAELLVASIEQVFMRSLWAYKAGVGLIFSSPTTICLFLSLLLSSASSKSHESDIEGLQNLSLRVYVLANIAILILFVGW